MSTDTAFGPRKCPACGREASPKAAHCTNCQTPLWPAGEITDAPPDGPRGELVLPSRPTREAPSLAQYTAAVLIILCILFGLTTLGIGLVSIPVLFPVFAHLCQDSVSINPFRRPALKGLAAWAAATGLALALFLSAATAFEVVYTGAAMTITYLFGGLGKGHGVDPLVLFLLLAAAGVGLVAAGFAGYLLARTVFPRNRG